MKLTKNQLKTFITAYARHRKLTESDSGYDAAFSQSLNFLEQYFGDYFTLDIIAQDESERFTDTQLFYEFLEYSLDYNEQQQTFSFNPTDASYICSQLRTRIDVRALSNLHAQASQLGINEKYLKGTLGTQEWLSSVDLERMLDLMDLRQQISVLESNPIEIGMQLHSARETHSGSELYSIPFILNKGSERGGVGSHWLAVIVTVNPANHTLSYRVHDSIPLTEEQKIVQSLQIEELLSAAIQIKSDSSQQNYAAFPGWVIDKERTQIIYGDVAKKVYAHGYHALHDLLNQPELANLVSTNIKATAYASCAKDSESLVRYVYREQLESLLVKPNQIEGLAKANDFIPAVGQDELRQLAPSKVQGFIEYIGSASPKSDTSLQTHPTVVKKLNEYTAATQEMSFPVIKDETLSISDYEEFFLQLHGQLLANKHTLDQLVLIPCNAKTLDGLITFLANRIPLLFNDLSFYLNDLNIEDIPSFIIKLKTLIPQLSEQGLKQLKLFDPQQLITDAQWQEIVGLVKERGVVIDLLLPEHLQASVIQRDLDQLISTNKFYNIQKKSSKSDEEVNTTVLQSRKKRTRPRIDPTASLSIDIEQQQQQQTEIGIEVKSSSGEQDPHRDFGVLDVLTFSAFDQLLYRLNSGAFNIPPASYLLSQEDARRVWDNWYGHIRTDSGGELLNRVLYGVTAPACEQLLKYSRQFSSGFDLNHLPDGFVLVYYPEGSSDRVLHYDNALLLSQHRKTKALAPDLKEQPQAQALAYPIFIDLIEQFRLDGRSQGQIIAAQWDKMQTLAYDAEAVRLFQRYLPELNELSADNLKKLFALTFGPEGTNPLNKEGFALILSHGLKLKQLPTEDLDSPAWNLIRRIFSDTDAISQIKNIVSNRPQTDAPNLLFRALRDNPVLTKQLVEWQHKIPSLNTKALLQVYSQKGSAGLTALFSQWQHTDLEVLKTLNDNLFSRAENYTPLLDADYQEAITAVCGFSGAKKIWWDTLLKAHGSKVGDDDLRSLVGSFKEFSRLIEEKELSFYPLDSHSFKDSSSMPIALARMSSILHQCSPADLKVQWQVISHISLAPSGATRAISETKDLGVQNSFVLPEMKVRTSGYSSLTGYRGVVDWHTIGTFTPHELKEGFYRSIAYQIQRMPLPFYQAAFAALEQRPFQASVKSELAALLFSTTVGAENNLFLDTEERSLEQWQGILDELENLKLPLGLTNIPSVLEQARAQFTSRLYGLTAPPPLPMLGKLVKLISHSLKIETSWPHKMKAELEKKMTDLNFTCQKLEIVTTHSGKAIYDGMKFYNDSDYTLDSKSANTSIFHTHVDTAIELLGQGGVTTNNLLISLISTFQIKKTDAHSVLTQSEQVWSLFLGTEALDYTLSLLTQISLMPIKLTPRNLNNLLTELSVKVAQNHGEPPHPPSIYKPIIEDFLEKKLGTYYTPNFFQQLRAEGIDQHTEEVISAKFEQDRDKVIAVLNHFLQPGDSAVYKSIVKKIAEITQSMSGTERKNFLALLQHPKLYEAALLNQKLDIAAFSQLLDAILKRGHANEFIYLLTHNDSSDEAEQITGLAAKATLFLTTILPDIEKNKSDTVFKRDIFDLVKQLLLKSPAESLTSPLEIKKDDLLTDLETLLNAALKTIEEGRTLDLHALHSSLTAFESTGINLDSLLTQLEELNKPQELSEPVTPVTLQAPGLVSRMVSGARYLWGLGFGRPVQESPIESAVASDTAIKPALDPESFKSVLSDISTEQKRRATYSVVFSEVIQSVYHLAEQYPGAKGLLIDFITQYIKAHNANTEALITDTLNYVQILEQEFAYLNDPDIVRSLCFHYSGVKGDFTPEHLLKIMRGSEYVALTVQHKKLVLHMISALLNNEKYFTDRELNDLLKRAVDPEKGEQLLNVLKEFFKHAPYPSLTQINLWLDRVYDSPTYADDLKEQYTLFDKHPCEREYGEPNSTKQGNGFILADALEKIADFHGVAFSIKDLEEMADQTVRVRTLSSEQLIEEFKAFNQTPKPQELTDIKLVALAAELLYRSKGKEGGMGSSFEINTTQYLAILGTLRSGSHNTSEIGTGEGKSRIMAICNACQFGLGKTVDFVTSDVQLATRDYLEFQSYFTLLGAKTNIIFADTDPSAYCLNGINYSDAANLSLFRNKARSIGKGAEVIHPDEQQRALMLDEADKAYFDAADTRYNFSTEADESLRGMEWIYPLLIEFILNDPDKEIEHLYYNDVDECNKRFIAYVISSETAPDRIAKVKALSLAQIETWLDAAVTVRSLKFDKHFTIEPDKLITTPYGPKIASEAKLISDGRKSANSKFSFGVHQCLHAYLNRLKQYPDRARADEEVLVRKLKECKQSFNIDVEKQIIYSSGSKNLLDEYQNGNLIAVTGTCGSIIERQEATNLYGQMQFISVPRHQGLHRKDKAVRLTEHRSAQIKSLVSYILECRRKEQPVLIICEDDKQSKKMYGDLEIALTARGDLGAIQLINNELSVEAENQAITAAGRAGMVTVSTSMIGRGTDIKLDKQAAKNGLEVFATYLPSERDMFQIYGRSGRAGATGGARLVLDKVELKEKLGKTSLNDGFYTATETYLRQEQAFIDRKKQCVRLIINLKSDFDKRLTDNFFNQFLAQVDSREHKQLEAVWMNFVKEKDQLWDGILKALRGRMNKTNPASSLVNRYLVTYQLKTQALWTELCRKMVEMDLRHQENPEIKPASSLRVDVGELVLDKQTRELITGFNVKKIVDHQVKIYDKYDPAHDGRAVIYKRPFEKIRAIFRGERKLFADFIAWREGHGILFADLRALFKGHISLKQFLTGTGSIDSKKQPASSDLKEKQQSSSYSTILRAEGMNRGSQSRLNDDEVSDQVVVPRVTKIEPNLTPLPEPPEQQRPSSEQPSSERPFI